MGASQIFLTEEAVAARLWRTRGEPAVFSKEVISLSIIDGDGGGGGGTGGG